MKQGYSHITMLVDRSGSMSRIATDAQGAVNKFVTDQQAVPGEATLLLVEFDASAGLADSERSIPWYHVVHDGDINQAPAYQLHARGNTALLDAIGRAITATGEQLAALDEADRPEHVYFVTQTDGQENSSREFTGDTIREMIKRQTDEFSWEFLFLGMGPDSFNQGHTLGFANVTKGAQAPAAYAGTYDLASANIAAHRGGVVHDLSATNADVDEDGTVTPAP